MLDEFVAVKKYGFFLALDFDRYDFILELAGFLRSFRLVLRSGGEFVLLLTGNVELLGDIFSRDTHVVLVIHIPQTIDDHGIGQLGITHAKAVARIVKHMRRGTHVFLATGDDDLRVAALDGLRCQMHGLEAAAADLAHHEGRHRIRQTGADHRLARRVLTETGGQHLTQNDFTDLLGLDAGLGQQGLDDLRAKIGGRNFC